MFFVRATAVIACGAALFAQQATPATALTAADGWRAEQIHMSDGGVWYAHIDKVVDAYGANEVIAADDKGRLLLLSVYSGQWTPHAVTCDGLWLAPTRSADVDPRVPGRELYAAGRAGSIHRTILVPQPFAKFRLDTIEIGHAAGEEFHAVIAADLIPGGPSELLAFGLTGAVYQLAADSDGSTFTMQKVATVPGRVRDVALVPAPAAGGAPAMFGASRSGDLLKMTLGADGLRHEVVLHEDCGLGRVAIGKGRPDVIYTTRDDGVVVRVATSGGKVEREAIFAGGQGLRGIAAGRFFADDREAIACYGYDKTVHVVSRAGDLPWTAEVVFTSVQKGHWLAVGELDGRNGTDELIATGFDGQIVLLSRSAGYALPGAAVAPSERTAPAAPKSSPPKDAPPAASRPLRIAGRVGERGLSELSPLRYHGGFESKTLVYETLVRRGADGGIAPALAASWRREDGDRTFVFTLRDGARWHDGQPLRAADVALHFRRWVGLPEHGWLRSNARIVAVRASGERELRVELDRPAALLADLCAVNPTAVLGPGAWSREGDFVRPVGSGPYAFADVVDDGRALRYRHVQTGALVDLVRIDGDAVDALLADDVDAVIGSWLVPVCPRRAAALRSDARFAVADGPGSCTWHLALRWDRGALADVARRAAVAAAIDRGELVRVVTAGFGDAATGWAAPSIAGWPQGRAAAAATAAAFAAPLVLAAGAADPLLVDTVIAQLARAGIRVVKANDGDRAAWDLRLERTHGVPYDPFTIVERHGRPAAAPNAATPQEIAIDAELADRIHALATAADENTWPAHYARIQARLDELVPVVPLFTPRRLAIAKKGLPAPALDHDMYALDSGWLAAAK